MYVIPPVLIELYRSSLLTRILRERKREREHIDSVATVWNTVIRFNSDKKLSLNKSYLSPTPKNLILSLILTLRKIFYPYAYFSGPLFNSK